jgi:hypothetical protein
LPFAGQKKFKVFLPFHEITANVLRVAAVGDFETLNWKYTTKNDRST